MSWLLCFIVGGILCVIAQLLIDKTALTPARILVFYVCTGVFLTAIGWYAPLVEMAGCGATVPLTGFGYCLAEGVENAVDKLGFTGIFIGGMEATAGGISAAMFFSLIMSIFFKGKPENL